MMTKILREHAKEELGFSGNSYYTKDGRKIVFNYDEQQTWVFYEYYEGTDRYQALMIVSKLSTYSKD